MNIKDLLIEDKWRIYASVSKILVGSDSGLSRGRYPATAETKYELLSIGTLWLYFSDILIIVQQFSFKKADWKKSFAECQQCQQSKPWQMTPVHFIISISL